MIIGDEYRQRPVTPLGKERMKNLAIIPARGGSKGLPRKNVRLLHGKPLIVHTIEHARGAGQVARTVVSTDDGEIADIARKYGAEVILRPAELANDTAASESALVHALDYLASRESYEPDLVVFLQCTSPLRKPDDIDRAIDLFLKEEGDSLLSVTSWHGFLWQDEGARGRPLNFDYRRRPRRQDFPKRFRENGSIFIFKPWVLRTCQNRLGGKIILYPMESWTAFEADTGEDFALCEWILKRRQGDST